MHYLLGSEKIMVRKGKIMEDFVLKVGK